MRVILKSVKANLISKNLVIQICKLKDSHWKNGISSQLKFFKKNCKANDINNLMYYENKLIGYTLLRRKQLLVDNKKKNYLHFDTLIVNKKYRNLGFSYLIMKFNSLIIKQNKLYSFLVCEKKMVKFYQKFKWNIQKKSNFKINNCKRNKTFMSLNFNQMNKRRINIEF